MKTTRTYRLCCAAVLSGAAWLALAPQSRAANLNYYVTLNTASLVGNSNAPFSLDVVLGSGAQSPNSDNTVTLSNFIFHGGSVGATSYSNGGESGSMTSSVTLTTSGEDNELAQYFGNTVTEIQFSVSMTSNTDNPFPDQFDIAILDSGLNNVQTTDPAGGNTLVLANINTAQTLASIQTYQSTSNGEAPGITVTVVPEPTSLVSLLAAVFGATGLYLRKNGFRRNGQA